MNNISLTQKRFLRGEARYDLTTDQELVVSTRAMNRQSSYRIPLSSLSPKSRKEAHSHFGKKSFAIIFFIVSLLLIVRAISNSKDEMVFMNSILFSAVSGILSATCLVSWFSSKYNFVIFDSLEGHPSIFLTPDKPNKNEFQSFHKSLSEQISIANDQRKDDSEKSMAKEIAELATLKEQGVLTEEEFSDAKKSILGTKSKFGF